MYRKQVLPDDSQHNEFHSPCIVLPLYLFHSSFVCERRWHVDDHLFFWLYHLSWLILWIPYFSHFYDNWHCTFHICTIFIISKLYLFFFLHFTGQPALLNFLIALTELKKEEFHCWFYSNCEIIITWMKFPPHKNEWKIVWMKVNTYALFGLNWWIEATQ